MHFSCCFKWVALASDETPCCNYKEEDKNIPQGLRDALKDYIESLTDEEYANLMDEIALLLGEKCFTREMIVVKVLSRILAHGDLRENKALLNASLRMQIEHRIKLLQEMELLEKFDTTGQKTRAV